MVNLYRAADLGRLATSGFLTGASSPTPVKSLPHLTTAIDHILFNSTSEILAFASQRLKDSMRLVWLGMRRHLVDRLLTVCDVAWGHVELP